MKYYTSTTEYNCGIDLHARHELRQRFCYPGAGVEVGEMMRCTKTNCYRGGMTKAMSQTTRKEILKRLRRRDRNAGREHKRKLLDQATGSPHGRQHPERLVAALARH